MVENVATVVLRFVEILIKVFDMQWMANVLYLLHMMKYSNTMCVDFVMIKLTNEATRECYIYSLLYSDSLYIFLKHTLISWRLDAIRVFLLGA